MKILLTLTETGIDNNPFSVYIDLDGFTTPILTGLTQSELLLGYVIDNVYSGMTSMKIKSTGLCEYERYLYFTGATPTLQYPFITEWTLNSGTTITLPLHVGGTFNATVNWGDGSSLSTITSATDTNRIHTYATGGVYQVKIYGECPGWSFNNTGDKLLITDIIDWGQINTFGGFNYLSGGFYGCSNLKSVGAGRPYLKATPTQSLGNLFNNTKITSISSGFFDLCTGVTNFNYTFRATDITSIPSGLFDLCTEAYQFEHTFRDCSLLTSIPSGLFNYNTKVDQFSSVFENSGITGITSGLFDNCIDVQQFDRSFRDCSSLTTIPDGLFKYNVKAWIFDSTFYNCVNLQVNPWTFYLSGEQSTRFADSVNPPYDVAFYRCFYRTSFSGNQGAAPDLWNCTYYHPIQTFQKAAFTGAGNSLTSLSNYNSIPAEWK